MAQANAQHLVDSDLSLLAIRVDSNEIRYSQHERLDIILLCNIKLVYSCAVNIYPCVHFLSCSLHRACLKLLCEKYEQLKCIILENFLPLRGQNN